MPVAPTARYSRRRALGSGEYARARQRPSVAERQAIILRDDVGGVLI